MFLAKESNDSSHNGAPASERRRVVDWKAIFTEDVCATFQVEGLLEDDEDEADPTKKRRQKMNVYDLFHLNYAELNVLAAKKKVPFHNLIKLRRSLYDKFAGEGFSLYSMISKNSGTVTVRCGSTRLNELLSKLPWLRTIDICGPNGSGKSHLACSLAFQSALAGTHVFFIDTDLTFCWRHRFAEVFQCDSILSHVTVLSILTLEKLIAFLDDFPHREYAQNSLLIIDSLSTILHSDRSNFCRMNFKQKKYTKEAIAWQFFEALKYAIRTTLSVGVFTRATLDDNSHLSEVFAEANLQLELYREEESSTIEMEVLNRTCEPLVDGPLTVITVEIEQLVRQNCSPSVEL